MAMHPIFGHTSTRRDLANALSAGRLPQVLLITGPAGVGKQRLALWLAQLTFCASATGGEPCGQCRGCRLTLSLCHPDLHWFVPILRPRAADPDRQVEEAREALAQLMADRRKHPVYGRLDGMTLHGMATVRILLQVSSLTTVEGGRRVILIGDADRLVPQGANPEAANAMLKLLEEPPASTLLILTTTDPTRVLPTIRSRAVPVRLGPLTDVEMDAGLALLRPDESLVERRRRIREAGGCLGRALDANAAEAATGEVAEFLEAASRGGAARFERALRQGPWAARGGFTALLDGLAETLAAAARATATGRTEALAGPLARVSDPGRVLRALACVEEAREAAQGNVNPQLLLAVLAGDLAEALWV